MGWRIPETTYQGSIGGRINKEQSEREYGIPELKKGQELGPVVATLKEGKTTPAKPLHRRQPPCCNGSRWRRGRPGRCRTQGACTPATRAGILEKLISTGFVTRKGDKQHQAPDAHTQGCGTHYDPAGAAAVTASDCGMGTALEAHRARRGKR